MQPWPTKSELRCAYYGRNKARIPLTSKNLPKVGRTDLFENCGAGGKVTRDVKSTQTFWVFEKNPRFISSVEFIGGLFGLYSSEGTPNA
jgi:hypothetical protein